MYYRTIASLISTLVISATLCSAAHAATAPDNLRVEYRANPLGIDTAHPRLSWQMPSMPGERGQSQLAYQILVASSEKILARNEGDLWDSKKVQGEDSIHIRYNGKPLKSNEECFWKVRLWDGIGVPSAWSRPARWTMGLLARTDWKAVWIGKDGADKRSGLKGTSWIWFNEGNPTDKAPVGTRYFRKVITVPSGREIKDARLFVAADNESAVFVNGNKVGDANNFKAATDFNAKAWMRPGKNVIAISVKNSGDSPNPAGLAALVEIEFAQGQPMVVATDDSWKVAKEHNADWQKTDFSDANWTAAKNLGSVGIQPWGEVSAPEDRRLPARYLRKEFDVEKHVRRATAYISGLGLSELYINGRKISNHVLSPGLTEYDKRVFYVTHDVTADVHRGENAIGVILGNGRFFAPRSTIPTGTRSYGFPKLLLQLHVEFADGTSKDIISDSMWRLTTDGPIRANNEYDGEEYDARREMSGWTKVGFDDSNWDWARSVSAPGGVLSAQPIEPIRVTQTMKPVSMKEIKPGTYIFDMGQNMVGWCRLKVSGPKGAQVSLRHAEVLKADGSLYLDNIRSAKVQDIYTLKGRGTEVYEPRFTYHGFRYVELTGFPGKPSLSTIEGCVVNDDVSSAGLFVCSNPLLNRIYRNVLWGVRGNYRSMPTDCPQRDERQGWLGDRSAESKGETYIFNTATLYAKWLQDMADGQKDNGSVSDVCPSYWPLYNDNVTWPSSTVIIPGSLYQQYGDTAIIESHYDSMAKWIDLMAGYMKDGIITKDSYGDWCVPPEEQSLIHSKDPKRKTAAGIMASTYFYHDLKLMAKYATMLGKSDDAKRYGKMAEELKKAFNDKFLNKELGQYDNGTQTSCVLPLAFGMVPDEQRGRIFDHLVKKITDETQGHIGTGLVGGQWLNRVLSDNGRADLAYSIASQTNYPSWGYMVQKGATTVWELWNGDTADPAMNSGNHVMLVGDLVIWFYEYLAGIKPDPEQPGFKHIIMKPHPVGDLKCARATHYSPYGLIVSDWKRDNGTFSWNITVPANTTATIFIPAASEQSVMEGGKQASAAKGMRFLRMENGAAVFEVESGSYHLQNQPPKTAKL